MTADVETPEPFKEDVPVGDSEEILSDDVPKVSDETQEPSTTKEGVAVPDEEEAALPIIKKMMDGLWLFFIYGGALFVVIYLIAAFVIDFKRATALFVITVTVIVYHIYWFWARKNEGSIEKAEDTVIEFLKKVDTDLKSSLIFSGILIFVMVVMMAATVRDAHNLISLFGMLVFMGLTWLFSFKPDKVMMRPVIGSTFIQFIFGFIVIRTSWGLSTMEFLSDIFTTLLGYTTAGSSFVFSWLTDGSLYGRPFQLAPDATGADMGSYFLGPPFFFSVLPTVIFFSALMSVGYYIRALPWLVRKLGKCGNNDLSLHLIVIQTLLTLLESPQDTFWVLFSVLRRLSHSLLLEIYLSVRPRRRFWSNRSWRR